MTDTTDAALDSWIAWIDDLPLPPEFQEGLEGLQDAITALRAEGDAAYARGVHDAAEIADDFADVWFDKDINGSSIEMVAQSIRALADAPPAPVVKVMPHAIEREIWQAMAWAQRHAKQLPGDIMPAYTDTGNSDAETEARHCAARIIAALLPQAGGGDA